ncbi:hypothetical protein D770_14655 [Flammeovirgaceae bacterium 311]|nr:hypothetical protein D770_14655 [Flammeovirgaceae bacterium 311]
MLSRELKITFLEKAEKIKKGTTEEVIPFLVPQSGLISNVLVEDLKRVLQFYSEMKSNEPKPTQPKLHHKGGGSPSVFQPS